MHSDPAPAVFGGFLLVILFILFWLFCLLLTVGGTAFWVWMIVDVVNNRRLREDERPTWLLVVILGHGIGALVYFFTVRKRPGLPMPAYPSLGAPPPPPMPPPPPASAPAVGPGSRAGE